MKEAVGLVMGLFSGVLIYFMAAMLAVETSDDLGRPSTMFVGMTLLGGWAASAFLLLRGAQTVSSVFRTGFLLGAAEWLTMACVGLVFSDRIKTLPIVDYAPGSEVEAAGAAFGVGIAAAFAGGFAVFMSVACMIAFAITFFIGREMKDKSGTPIRNARSARR